MKEDDCVPPVQFIPDGIEQIVCDVLYQSVSAEGRRKI